MLANVSSHEATRHAALRRSRRLPAQLAASLCPHGWIAAFAGMTHTALVSRRAGSVSV